MLLYAGSVFVILDDNFWDDVLILIVTLCPIVGETTIFASGSENFIFSSNSFAIPSASSFSICLPALLSVITPSSFNVEKLPLNAKSPFLKSIPTPIASITPLPA